MIDNKTIKICGLCESSSPPDHTYGIDGRDITVCPGCWGLIRAICLETIAKQDNLKIDKEGK